MQIYKGNFVWSKDAGALSVVENGYVVVEGGAIKSCSAELPAQYKDEPVTDFGDALVVPGFVDLHMHSSQIAIQGLGIDQPSGTRLDTWLHPIEHKYAELAYAKQVNKRVVETLKKNGTTRCAMMSATALASTLDMFEQLGASGLFGYIGKMNSDYSDYKDPNETTAASKAETLEFLAETAGKSERVKPMLCPEFLPCCSVEMLAFLGDLKEKHGLPLKTHMSGANAPDIEQILRRFPDQDYYIDVYDEYGLLGENSILIHCNHAADYELARMRETGTFLAHCPTPLLTMGSRMWLDMAGIAQNGPRTGLGSDMGGGYTLYMPSVIVAAISLSKWAPQGRGLSFTEAYYLATRGGGRFFGQVGAFEPGYAFDALVINDSELLGLFDYTTAQRLERFIFCGNSDMITHRFAGGDPLK